MLARRVIVCLDVQSGRVVKGVEFTELRNVGDPAELAARYERAGADELVFLDIGATREARATLLDLARRTAERLFIPLTIGGGVRTVVDMGATLRAGADKVVVNSAGVGTPGLYAEAAARFGSQCVVASIDARREGDSWRVYTHGGSQRTELDAVSWAHRVAELGAGEILLTSIDRDGRRTGYDIELTRAVTQAVSVPVIASGGAGSAEHLRDAILTGGAAAVLVAGILHDGVSTVHSLKTALRASRIPVRLEAA